MILRKSLPKDIEFRLLMGGLAKDSEYLMSEAMQRQIQATWKRIQEKLPETRFNYDFWQVNQPRRSTFPACRAVIAARQIDPVKESSMILGIQEAYYLDAKNPSDDETLIQIAMNIDLDAERFSTLLDAPETRVQLESEIQQSRSMGVQSFPSLVLNKGQDHFPVPVDYTGIGSMLETIEWILA